MSSDELKPFREVRSAFTQVDIPPGKAGLSFTLHTVELADDTRGQASWSVWNTPPLRATMTAHTTHLVPYTLCTRLI